MRPTDVRIREVGFGFEDFRYRTPLKFGGVPVTEVTLLNVTMTVETASGGVAEGFGSMPLGNVWAWPSKEWTYAQTLDGLKRIAVRMAHIYGVGAPTGHPIRITHELEKVFPPLSASERGPGGEVSAIPPLATLVVASPFDAALHDAYGKAHGLNCYRTYEAPFFDDDLGAYLNHPDGPDFGGERLQRYVSTEPQANMPLYHLVGALDPLTPAEVAVPVGDGGPEHLGDWIRRDGLTHLKIKLNGDDLAWDVDRIIRVHRIAEGLFPERDFSFSLDFNERCPNVEYLLETLRHVRAASPLGYGRIQYVEQPTARDLRANPANRMHQAAKLKPVVIDESLLDLETLLLARDLGYTGVAFKACKGQTQSLLLAAAAQKLGLFRCVQDLTCPGASLVQSAGLAAHIPGVAAIEANARQFVPAANAGWNKRFPGLFETTDGTLHTGQLTGPGLGAVPTKA